MWYELLYPSSLPLALVYVGSRVKRDYSTKVEYVPYKSMGNNLGGFARLFLIGSSPVWRRNPVRGLYLIQFEGASKPQFVICCNTETEETLSARIVSSRRNINLTFLQKVMMRFQIDIAFSPHPRSSRHNCNNSWYPSYLSLTLREISCFGLAS